MRFRLTYEGELRPSQLDPLTGQPDRLAPHKQMLRKAFHRQLKHLWGTNRFLKEHEVFADEFYVPPARMPHLIGRSFFGFNQGQTPLPMAQYLASKYQENGYRFVPLVREDISLLCSLEILLLRRDFPLGVISAGDLDNRIKTLIDGLRKPKNASELRGNETPSVDEDPFFCLLEDDDLVTGLAVETDMLLDPPQAGDGGDARVKVIISVELKPDNVTMFNLNFA
jgi:hypothetical protein